MFQLIVVVISIGLVVLMALAMIFWGGEAFTTGQDKALYAQLMNHGSQIEGAMKLYQSDKGVYPSGTSTQQLATLVTGGGGSNAQSYLQDIPAGNWYINEGTIYRDLADIAQCKRVNATAKKDLSSAATYDGCPPCKGVEGGDWENFKDWPGCRQESLATP